jgi:hypothetical protein
MMERSDDCHVGAMFPLVSWFRSSQELDISLKANFETITTLGINNLLVSFDSEIRSECDIMIMRISESGH